MKYLNKIIFSAALVSLSILFACKKSNPFYANGHPVNLSTSTPTVASSSSDSASTALILNWTSPGYATPLANQRFVVEIDTSTDFANPYSWVVNGALTDSVNASQLNNIMAQFGLKANGPSILNVRIASSYANNNEPYISNDIKIVVTPYTIPISLTASSTNALALSLANSADTVVSFNWNASEYGGDTITYALQFDTVGGSFTNPQLIENGSLLTTGITGSTLNLDLLNAGVTPPSSNNVEFRVVGYVGDNYTKPSVFSNTIVINVSTFVPILYLYLPGDYQGWSPATAPVIASTTPNINSYEGYVYVPNTEPSTLFKFTNAPDWNHTSYGDGGSDINTNTTSSGALSTSGSAGNLNWPQNTFTLGGEVYTTVNTTTLTWASEIVTWSVIGDATPGGWSNDTQLTWDPVNNDWYINGITLNGGGALKFRSNDEWNDPMFPGGNSNLGGSLTNLSYGGANIPITTTGTYNIILNLSTPLHYTTTITQQ